MRRAIPIFLITLVCGGLAANALAGISVLCGISNVERAVRVETGQERARQALGLQYVAADFRHL